MGTQRVTLTLTELRCIAQSEGSGGSEPYLWVTYFAFGAQQLPNQTGLLGIVTPTHSGFRAEFPNGMKAGQTATIPPFIASASFDMDLDLAPLPKLIGCIATLLEEDSTPEHSMESGQIAYAKEMEVQLNDFAHKRLLAGDFGPLTDAEFDFIKGKVAAKARAGAAAGQGIGALFTNQDDNIDTTYVMFAHPVQGRLPELKFQFFDFPELRSGGDRFLLSGGLSLGPATTNPVDRCAAQRAAVKAKEDEIKGFQSQLSSLQTRLAGATPQQKAGLVAEIERVGGQLEQAQAELPALEAALKACEVHLQPHPGTTGGSGGNAGNARPARSG